MRLHEFTNAEQQLDLLNLVIRSALTSINDQYRREIAQDMRADAANTANTGHAATAKAFQNLEPGTNNIEVSLRPFALEA